MLLLLGKMLRLFCWKTTTLNLGAKSEEVFLLGVHSTISLYILPYLCTFYHIFVHSTISLYILPYLCHAVGYSSFSNGYFSFCILFLDHRCQMDVFVASNCNSALKILHIYSVKQLGQSCQN